MTVGPPLFILVCRLERGGANSSSTRGSIVHHDEAIHRFDRGPVGLVSVGEAGPTTLKWQVYFSPKGGCTQALVRTIGTARTWVVVQAYSFTSVPIAQALIDAQKRGASVRVLLDRSDVDVSLVAGSGHPIADMLVKAKVPTWVDASHSIAHNKVMVIDARTVVTGSFNFTNNAEERNAENLLIVDDADLADAYTQNWEKHQAHSKEYPGEYPGASRLSGQPPSSIAGESGFYGTKDPSGFRLMRVAPSH